REWHLQVTTRGGRRRMGARDEPERSDAAQIGIAHTEHAVAHHEATGRGTRGARPEPAHGGDVVAAGWRRDVDPDPGELPAGDLLHVQYRAGDPEHEERRQAPEADHTQRSHDRLLVVCAAPRAAHRRTGHAAGVRNWTFTLKR